MIYWRRQHGDHDTLGLFHQVVLGASPINLFWMAKLPRRRIKITIHMCGKVSAMRLELVWRTPMEIVLVPLRAALRSSCIVFIALLKLAANFVTGPLGLQVRNVGDYFKRMLLFVVESNPRGYWSKLW